MRRLVILSTMLLLISSLAFAETIFFQGFEDDVADNWVYSTQPDGMDRQLWWGRTTESMGGATVHEGDWYWASWHLQGSECTITFDTVALPYGFSYTLSFYYYTRNLDPAAEYSRYSVAFDDGTEWNDWIYLEPDTNEWTLVHIEIPPYENQVRMKLSSQYNGMTKNSHWDSFKIVQQDVPFAPVIYNINTSQRTDGSKIVDIYYDLYLYNIDTADISLFLSDDGGVTYDFIPDPDLLSGDIGFDVNTGEGKHILWEAGEENQTFDGDQFRLRVIADDGMEYIVATPVFDLPGGFYTEEQSVTITCDTNEALIYYTEDGTEPTEGSSLYQEPISITWNTTLKARAFKQGWMPSEIVSEEYIFMPEDFVFVQGTAGVTFSPGGLGYFTPGDSYNVSLSDFYISKYEVTQAEYLAVMGVNPGGSNSTIGDPLDHPINNVSWFNAIEYCNRLSMMEGLTPAYSYGTYGTNPDQWPAGWNTSNANHTNVSCNWSADGYRLPTEMQREYAARGGVPAQNAGTFNHTYAGTNVAGTGPGQLGDYAWYSANNTPSGTKPVGTKIPNELGLYDMSGNVRNWVWDIWSSSYPSGSFTDPTGPVSGTGRVVRGGSWVSSANGCSVSFRYDADATYTGHRIGFRVSRVVP
jgi:formylglycine-generating enzyme